MNPALALNNFVSEQPSEKTYVHKDKDFYYTDETIWLNLYLLEGSSHLNSEKSQLVYIDLLNENDSLLIQKKLYVENGNASSQIDLNNSFKSGLYTLRAYTHYMQHESNPVPYEQQITILNHKHKSKLTKTIKTPSKSPLHYNKSITAESALQISFAPEGGPMVNGIETSVAIKITDQSSKGVSTQGKIVDEKDKIIAFFKSQEFGLGVFKIVPLANKKYFAVLGDSTKYELPKALPKGYILNIKNKGDVLFIDLITNIPKGLSGFYLLGHIRGQIIYKHRVSQEYDGNSYRIRFLNTEVSKGIAQFMVFTADANLVCERSLFIHHNNNDVKLSIDSINGPFETRKNVSANLNVVDKEGKQVSANVSLSVTELDRLDLSNSNHSLENWLLLNSDIGAAIANPGYFFEDVSSRKKNLLDALMMTQKRNFFNWKKVLEKDSVPQMNTNVEKGIIITGSVVDFKNKLVPKQAHVKLRLLGLVDGVQEEEKVTNTNGEFSFGPYVFSDTLKAVINAESLEKRRNGKSQKLTILIENQPFFHKSKRKNSLRNSYILQDQKTGSSTTNFRSPSTIDFQMDSNVIELDEAIVSEKKITRQDSINVAFKKLSPLYTSPARRIFPDSLPGSYLRVFDLLKLYGARFVGAFPNEVILLRLRFGGSPLFVVDGLDVDAAFVDAMNVDDIEFIDILNPGNAGGYSNRSGNGVVVIYTRGSLNLPQKRKPINLPNIKGFEVAGFSAVKNFQITDYSTSKTEQSKQDHRSTLYWQPNIKIKSSEQQNSSSVSFYTNDLPGKYVIRVEGITTDGRPINAVKVFEVIEK